MQRSQTIRPLIRLASYLVALILVLLPFHALFTTWAGSNFGHLDVFRVWKELLMVPLGLFAAWMVYSDKAFQRQLARSWLIRCIVAYSALFIVFAAFSLMTDRATPTAIIYSLVISLRFLWWFLIVWVITRSDPFVNQQWLKLLLVPASFVVLFGLLQKFVLPADFLRHFGYGPDTIPAVQTVDEKSSYQRVQSTLRGANPFGAYLVVVVSAIVASLRRKKWLAFLLAAAAVALFFTYSRSAWIGMVVALAVLGFLQLSSRRGRQVMIASLVIAAVVGAGAIWRFQQNDVLQNTLFHSDENSQSVVSSNEMRTSALTTAAKEVIAEPLGRGPGTAGPASSRNDQPARISENYFLQVGQEVGILGVLLILAIFGFTARALWLRRRYVLAQVLLASLAGIIVINLMSHAWTDDTLSLLWWGFAGAVMSLPAILRTELRHETKKETKASQKKSAA
jgi:hypothetical protein